MSDATAPLPSSPTPAQPRLPAYPFLAQSWGMVAVRGALSIVFGLIALLAPGITILSLVLVFAAYALVDGVFAIAAAFRAAQKHSRWGLLALEGVADILMGAIAFLFPGLTAITFVVLLAVWALVTGSLLMGAGFRVAPENGRWWLILSGLSSVLLGLALAILPAAGALVVTWWIGAYAVVFGGMLLVLAFHLRRRALG